MSVNASPMAGLMRSTLDNKRGLSVSQQEIPIINTRLIQSLMPQATQQAELANKLYGRAIDLGKAVSESRQVSERGQLEIIGTCGVCSVMLFTLGLELLLIGLLIDGGVGLIIAGGIILVMLLGLWLGFACGFDANAKTDRVPACQHRLDESLVDFKTLFDQHGEGLIQTITDKLQEKEDFIAKSGTKQSFVDSTQVFPEEAELRQLLAQVIKGQALVQRMNELSSDSSVKADKDSSLIFIAEEVS